MGVNAYGLGIRDQGLGLRDRDLVSSSFFFSPAAKAQKGTNWDPLRKAWGFSVEDEIGVREFPCRDYVEFRDAGLAIGV